MGPDRPEHRANHPGLSLSGGRLTSAVNLTEQFCHTISEQDLLDAFEQGDFGPSHQSFKELRFFSNAERIHAGISLRLEQLGSERIDHAVVARTNLALVMDAVDTFFQRR